MKFRIYGLLAAAALTGFFAAPVLAQEEPAGTYSGDVQQGDPDAQQGYVPGEATQNVETAPAYGDAQSAAATQEHQNGTDEGAAEWTGQPFDGTNQGGSYQDTNTLEPSSGIVAEPNSDSSDDQ